MDVVAKRPDRLAIILAGGDGMRLRPLTRRIAGDERPKQFCRFVDGETLLDRTCTRVARDAPEPDLPGPDPPPRAVLCAAPRRGTTRAAGRSAVRPGHSPRNSLRPASGRGGGTRGRGRPFPGRHRRVSPNRSPAVDGSAASRDSGGRSSRGCRRYAVTIEHEPAARPASGSLS
jgi:hypothetical protein